MSLTLVFAALLKKLLTRRIKLRLMQPRREPKRSKLYLLLRSRGSRMRQTLSLPRRPLMKQLVNL